MNIYSTSPVGQGLHTKIMAKRYFESQFRPRTVGFAAFFGNTENGSQSFFTDDASAVDIEVMSQDVTIATLGTRGAPTPLGDEIFQGGKSSYGSRVFPISTAEGAITTQDMKKRGFGVDQFTEETDYERFRQLAVQVYNNLITSQLWLLEFLAAQAFLTGKQPSNNKGGEFNFGRNPANIKVAANPWTDDINGTPLQDIATLCELVEQNGAAMPDFVGSDDASFNAFKRSPEVLAFADNRRYDIMYVGNSDKKPDSKYDRYIKAGWTPRAYFTTENGYEVWYFTYNATYVDKNKDRQKFSPDGTVFVTSTAARFDRYFGPSDKMPGELMKDSIEESHFGVSAGVVSDIDDQNGSNAVIDPRQFNFFGFSRDRGQGVVLELQTAPIYAPTQVNAVATMSSVVL